ncbi:hypothetical protein ABW20_dc0106204 [Dactylellina cionopaga]|nr:hypothetical protein ABW20_dc0106204 [Dactylellina cionopaga]
MMQQIVVLNQLSTRGAMGGGPLELAPSVSMQTFISTLQTRHVARSAWLTAFDAIDSANYNWSHAFNHRILLLRKHVPKTDPPTVKRHLRFVFVLKSSGIDIQNTNLSRPDQFFVIKVTKNGIEDEKHQFFSVATGAISMAESFATSGHNSEEHHLYTDSDEEPELSPPPGKHLKRKRSNDTVGESEFDGAHDIISSSSNEVASANVDSDYSSDTVDLVRIPEPLAESGAGSFPVLSQARGSQFFESQEKSQAGDAGTSGPGIPQKFGRMIVPDSDGESEDDVL